MVDKTIVVVVVGSKDDRQIGNRYLIRDNIFQAQLRKALVKEILDLCRCLQCPYVVLGDADDVGSAWGVSSYRQQSHAQPRRESLTSAPTRL
jgi:hypothetical protein